MWKKIVVVVALFIILSVVQIIMAIEEPKVGQEPTTPQKRWKTAGTFFSAGGAPTDLTGSERTYLLIQAAITADIGNDGKIILKKLKYGVNALRFRLSGLTVNSSVVLVIYTGVLENQFDCEFVPRGTLTFTIGTQGTIELTFEFADTCIITNYGASATEWTIASPANDTCAEVIIDILGDDILCIVPITIGCDSKLFMKDV